MRTVELAGYPSYSVTDTGSVISHRRAFPKTLTPMRHSGGYLKVSLCAGGKPRQLYVHRLVASAFVPNPKDLPTVNHIDGDKHNNRVDNLEWATHSQQTLHMYRVLKRKHPQLGRKGASSGASKAVLQLCLDGTHIRRFDCMRDASACTGASVSGISQTCSGQFKSSGGFKWRYAEHWTVGKKHKPSKEI